jgi:hypothetical protein
VELHVRVTKYQVCGDRPGLPFVVYRLDDKAKGGTDSIDIFTHDLLDDSGLARIVKTAASRIRESKQTGSDPNCSQHQDPELLVFESSLSKNR